MRCLFASSYTTLRAYVTIGTDAQFSGAPRQKALTGHRFIICYAKLSKIRKHSNLPPFTSRRFMSIMLNQGVKTKVCSATAGKSANATSSPESTSLEAVVERAVKGEKEALHLLCETIANDVLLRAIFVSGNNPDAEDIAQEALMRICRNIQKLQDPKAFRSWLSRIVINEARRHFRRNSRHGAVLSIDEYKESIAEERNEALPYENAEKQERIKSVMEVIRILPTKQREAVLLHYYDGLNVTEVAVIMGTSKANISQNLTLARKKLKNELEKIHKKTQVSIKRFNSRTHCSLF